MSTYTLSVVVHGEGDDPNNRCHWSFVFHRAGADRGNLLQVLLIDLDRLWYQLDRRDGVTILSASSEGCFQVATFSANQYAQVHSIISKEPAPRNGRDRCQDWTVNCIIALEAEELVLPGTSDCVSGLVGKSVTSLAQSLGGRWVANRR
ncbi:hypothetical protein COCC4DRAFT_63423 [Bipolaris maydis ATCC 48331]|uniref:Uncharacterized protein n=2 Tax=Cochliobolus heterostrophus TaxID=5016 RepID=M2UVZ7_COCH5|nr:uncharacterized protein COCC4DRAFT_63423 [Bipolaris maydis ATCC 48331]EMD92018.1 hypothetical protein COCHEDRAFT_1100668 [Bipolaris maydis C5]KAJ5021374.1 hypothetical protein J3E73DRAFT_262068 [Bipolaris maydis]ENI02499.1 hypothetical protein COCC4DRAFT_63423 [Bipolaris maydis ATCC 48331]KAJ5061353.1 hypothetical protein J3E74DRAFT_290165 [Bipolaris maydis]KAJ6198483.1 hypothetical protein J3E72DRAFT_394685 [Bipolaris maydis]